MSLPLNLQDAIQRIKRGRLSEAVTILRDLTARHPTHVTAYVLLAQALEAAGQPTEALQVWREAYVLLPNSPRITKGIERTAGVPFSVKHAPQSVAPPESEASSDGHTLPEPVLPDPVQSAEEQPPTEAEPLAEAEPPPAPAFPATPPPAPPVTSPEIDWLNLSADVFEQDAPAAASAPASEEADALWDNLGNTVDTLEQAFTHAIESTPRGLGDDVEDLDALIEELDGARIVPSPDVDILPPPTFDDAEMDEMVSETLARIYLAQKQYQEAARIYELLAQQHPERAGAFREKAAEAREMV